VTHFDEPPTKYGPSTFEITFSADGQNDYVADSYTSQYKRKKRVKFAHPVVIHADDIKKFNSWRPASKSEFLLSELNVDIHDVQSAGVSCQPEFGITDRAIRIDSFNICKDYQLKRSLSTGGHSIKVYLISQNDSLKFLDYAADDFNGQKFDLQSYLMLQPILRSKIPKEFMVKDFFDNKSLLEVLSYYYKVIECEGYYYTEFKAQHPNRTEEENRMMIGWDFSGYLENRSKK